MKATLCPGCGQPMLPKGVTKRPNEYDHAHGCPEDESPTARLREAIDDYASERWVDGFGFDGGDPNDHGNDARAARARLDALLAEQEAESAERRAEEAEKKLNAGGPYDALRYAVVGLCLESRKYPKDRQAAFLRDELLTMIDPHMSITQHIRESAKPLAEGEGETR